jgi:hypothetical protein
MEEAMNTATMLTLTAQSCNTVTSFPEGDNIETLK